MLSAAQLALLAKFEGDYEQIGSDEELWTLLQQIDSPIQLHLLPELLNWDSGWTMEVISWILEHPMCDAGTALYIYWLNEPQFWTKQERAGQIPAWAKDGYALHKKTEALYLSKKFPVGAIRFEPRDDALLPKQPEKDSDLDREIPEPLKQATPGVDVPEYWKIRERAGAI